MRFTKIELCDLRRSNVRGGPGLPLAGLKISGSVGRAGSSTGALTLLSASDPVNVAMSLTAFMPQVSFNFGTSDGWSYLSAGYGAAWINSTAEGTSAFVPPGGSLTLSTKEGASGALHYGIASSRLFEAFS